jgi:hypothetical protein
VTAPLIGDTRPAPDGNGTEYFTDKGWVLIASAPSYSNPFTDIFAAQAKQHDALLAKYGPNYNRPALVFNLNVAEKAVVDAWLESLLPEIKAKGGRIDVGGTPYYGAMGGGVIYSFLSTSLGDIITVKEAITGKELNVTEALGWFFFG